MNILNCEECGLPMSSDNGTSSTLVGYISPPGHCHDDNRVTKIYTCPNGHWAQVVKRKSCPACEWKGTDYSSDIYIGVDEWPDNPPKGIEPQRRLVVHCKKADYDTYIGRPGRWGNPFTIGTDGTREEVIEKYRRWLPTQPHLMAQLPSLRGKVLGCWCAPAACHGDVLSELANKVE